VIPATSGLNERISQVADRAKRLPHGWIAYYFSPSFSGDDRQEVFTESWSELVARIRRLTPERGSEANRDDVIVEMLLTLWPSDTTQAGLAITANMLRQWAELGGDIMIDAFGA
jgi:hypothetical protein